MGAWHHLNTDQTGMWVDPEEHIERLLQRPSRLYDRHTNESGEQMFERKGWESKAPAGKGHGAGLYDSIVKRNEPIREPISMSWNPQRMTSPQMLDGYHRAKVAAMKQQETGQQVRLPVEYVDNDVFNDLGLDSLHTSFPYSQWSGANSYEEDD